MPIDLARRIAHTGVAETELISPTQRSSLSAAICNLVLVRIKPAGDLMLSTLFSVKYHNCAPFATEVTFLFALSRFR